LLNAILISESVWQAIISLRGQLEEVKGSTSPSTMLLPFADEQLLRWQRIQADDLISKFIAVP
jgi:hypothetical protein